MAKPKPTIPAKARPLSLVARSPWREKNSSQILVYLVNTGSADERKESLLKNNWQTASKSEFEYSQESRQENALAVSRNCWHEEQLQKTT